jgi:N,N'-diacetylchitobiose transport system permease protein
VTTTRPGRTELDPKSAGLPAAAVAADPRALLAVRRRRPLSRRLLAAGTPYALLAPSLVVLVAVLGYPLYLLVKLSFQDYGLPELIAKRGTWTGIDNYTAILGDSRFWEVLVRTLVFTAVNVGLTLVLGTLIALLMTRVSAAVRILLSTGLVLVWAMPVVVAVQVWYWMVDVEFGVLSWTLSALHLGDFENHDWFANPVSGLGVITALVVWGAIPFVAITLYAGLSQVPRELTEAAAIDGAGPWRSFRDVTFPLLKPIFVILASLSIIWDFTVFTQVWLMRFSRPTDDYVLMSVYAFLESFGQHEYGAGAAIALVIVATMFAVTFVYVRQLVRMGDVR